MGWDGVERRQNPRPGGRAARFNARAIRHRLRRRFSEPNHPWDTVIACTFLVLCAAALVVLIPVAI